MALEEAPWLSTHPHVPPPALPTAEELGMNRPQTARMYDYFLDGKDYYDVDRDAAEEVLVTTPHAKTAARANRHFLHVGMQYLSGEEGIDQVLDIGTGIPTSPNTHQVVQWHRPHARVLYTDHDPIVMTNAQGLMASTPEGRVDYITADLRDPEKILAHRCLAGDEPVLDLKRPVALSLVAILHFIIDKDDPVRLLRTLMDPMASGSYLLMSHATADLDDTLLDLAKTYEEKGMQIRLRSEGEIERLVEATGWEIQEPGIQPVNRWWPGRPEHLAPTPLLSDAEASVYGLLARKP